MRFIFLVCNYLPSFPDTAGGEGNTAIKREQSQTCLNYAEQEQGKANIVGLILH